MRQAYCFYLPIRALRVRNDLRRRRGLSREQPGADRIVRYHRIGSVPAAFHMLAQKTLPVIATGHMRDFIYRLMLVHSQVTIIFVVSVCLFVQSFSQPSDPISIKLGHMLYVWV